MFPNCLHSFIFDVLVLILCFDDAQMAAKSAAFSIETKTSPEQPTIVAFFNHKGGVAKTTTCSNTAAALVHRGHKVLLVDADPQCNLTNTYDLEPSKPKESTVARVSTSARMLHHSILQSDTAKIDAKPFEDTWIHRKVVKPNLGDLFCQLMRNEMHWKSDRDAKAISPNLWIIAGNPEILKYEQHMDGEDILLRQRQALFRKTIIETAMGLSCDIVLVDVCPNAGFFNKVLVMSCDAIQPTAFCDRHSYQSTETLLEEVLPKWIAWHETVIVEQKKGLPRDCVAFVKRVPRLLPLLLMNYEMNEGKVSEFASSWFVTFVDLFGRQKPVIKDLYVNKEEASVVLFVPTIPQLLYCSQICRKPLFDMDEKDMTTNGIVYTGAHADLQLFRLRYQSLANYMDHFRKNIATKKRKEGSNHATSDHCKKPKT